MLNWLSRNWSLLTDELLSKGGCPYYLDTLLIGGFEMANKLRAPSQYKLLLILLPVIIWFYFIAVRPIFIAIVYSFSDWSFMNLKLSFIGLGNYIQLFNDSFFYTSLSNTLMMVFINTIGQIGLALLLSFFCISRYVKIQEFHRTVIFFPVVVSSVVIGFVWTAMYSSTHGLINIILESIGLKNLIRPWLDDYDIVLYTVSIPNILKNVGFYMIMFMAAIKNVPVEVLESSYLDGVSEFRQNINIVLPMIYPTFKVATVLCVANTMRIFDHIVVMTNGGPARGSEVLSLYAYNTSFNRMQFSYGSTIAIAIVVVTLILTSIIRVLLGGKRYE